MGNPLKYTTYLTFAILSIASFAYYMSITDIWDLYGYNLGFLVLVASIFYLAYMFVHELTKSDAQVAVEQSGDSARNVMVVERNFMMDIYFKYLFSFAFAVLVFFIILALRTNFTIFDVYPSNWYYIIDLYVNLILPVYLICEVLMTNKYRHHHFFQDILVLFAICFGHCAYKILIRSLYYEQYKIVFPTMADYLMIFMIAINGISFYDYALYRKVNPDRDYALYV